MLLCQLVARFTEYSFLKNTVLSTIFKFCTTNQLIKEFGITENFGFGIDLNFITFYSETAPFNCLPIGPEKESGPGVMPSKF